MIAERDLDAFFDLHDQRFRPVDRDGWYGRALVDLAGAHRALEDPIGRDARVVDRAADILTPINPIGEVANLRARPELALGRATARGGHPVKKARGEDVVLDP